MKSTSETINARHQITIDYCKSRDWDRKNLTITQIMEIRNTEKWINADI